MVRQIGALIREGTVMSRPKITDQERGYLKSYWDELGVMEADYTGVVTLYVTRSRRPGVMEYRMTFTSLVGGDENTLHTAAYKFDFPNSSNVSLAGQLWAGARILHDLVTDAWERTATPAQKGQVARK